MTWIEGFVPPKPDACFKWFSIPEFVPWAQCMAVVVGKTEDGRPYCAKHAKEAAL